MKIVDNERIETFGGEYLILYMYRAFIAIDQCMKVMGLYHNLPLQLYLELYLFSNSSSINQLRDSPW